MIDPIYTAENVRLAYELRWSVALFWKNPAIAADTWLSALREATEADGVRILEHRFTNPNVSQFLISTKPEVAPSACLRSVKGRLQYLIRGAAPRAFHRNYSITSLGGGNRETVEKYVATQLQHHQWPDERVGKMLEPLQFADESVDLGQTRSSSHGKFIFNLHLTAVHQQRYSEIREDTLRRTLEMLVKVARNKEHILSRVGMQLDHVHWTVGCGIDESPVAIGLSYLNNIAFAHQMQPLFQFGFFAGTFGPYDMNAVRMKTSPVAAEGEGGAIVLADQSALHRDKLGGGEEGSCDRSS